MRFVTRENFDTDVVIAGGGPAGAACGFYLAKAGCRVIIIDFQSFPRDKVCGDFVGPVAINEMQRMGFSDMEELSAKHLVNKAAVFLDGRELIVKDIPAIEGLPAHGRVIPREDLDHLILEKAKEAGVKVLTPYRLKNFTVYENAVIINASHKGKDVFLTGRILIGADGSSSTVARIMHGGKPDPENRILAVRAYFDDIHCVPHQAELYFSSKSFPGYYWFFPISATSANVGVGMVLENFPKNDVNLKELLMDLVHSDPVLSRKIGNGTLRDKVVGWPLSTYNPNKALVSNRVLLTGDAAGLINSLNGEGIQYALLSGRWAAESVISCLAKSDLSGSALRLYENKIRKELALDMSIANLVIQFIRNKNLNSFWLQLLAIMSMRASKDDAYANTAGGILAGLVPAKDALGFSFLSKSALEGVLTLVDGANQRVRNGPMGILSTGMSITSQTLTILLNAIHQTGAYWQWSKGIVSKGNHVAGFMLEEYSDKILERIITFRG